MVRGPGQCGSAWKWHAVSLSRVLTSGYVVWVGMGRWMHGMQRKIGGKGLIALTAAAHLPLHLRQFASSPPLAALNTPRYACTPPLLAERAHTCHQPAGCPDPRR